MSDYSVRLSVLVAVSRIVYLLVPVEHEGAGAANECKAGAHRVSCNEKQSWQAHSHLSWTSIVPVALRIREGNLAPCPKSMLVCYT